MNSLFGVRSSSVTAVLWGDISRQAHPTGLCSITDEHHFSAPSGGSDSPVLPQHPPAERHLSLRQVLDFPVSGYGHNGNHSAHGTVLENPYCAFTRGARSKEEGRSGGNKDRVDVFSFSSNQGNQIGLLLADGRGSNRGSLLATQLARELRTQNPGQNLSDFAVCLQTSLSASAALLTEGSKSGYFDTTTFTYVELDESGRGRALVIGDSPFYILRVDGKVQGPFPKRKGGQLVHEVLDMDHRKRVPLAHYRRSDSVSPLPKTKDLSVVAAWALENYNAQAPMPRRDLLEFQVTAGDRVLLFSDGAAPLIMPLLSSRLFSKYSVASRQVREMGEAFQDHIEAFFQTVQTLQKNADPAKRIRVAAPCLFAGYYMSYSI